MSNHKDYTAPTWNTGAFARAGVFAPCEHDNMFTSHDEPNAWECEDCGVLVPKTAEEIDWCRTDVPTCARCCHSEAFGGPMVERTPWMSKTPQLFHASCLTK